MSALPQFRFSHTGFRSTSSPQHRRPPEDIFLWIKEMMHLLAGLIGRRVTIQIDIFGLPEQS
jgi:hypothetical protein